MLPAVLPHRGGSLGRGARFWALAWNIGPAGLGNMIGGFALVAWPFWFVQRHGAAPSGARA